MDNSEIVLCPGGYTRIVDEAARRAQPAEIALGRLSEKFYQHEDTQLWLIVLGGLEWAGKFPERLRPCLPCARCEYGEAYAEMEAKVECAAARAKHASGGDEP